MNVAIFNNCSVSLMPKTGSTVLRKWKVKQTDIIAEIIFPIYASWREPYHRMITGLYTGLYMDIQSELDHGQGILEYPAAQIQSYFFDMLSDWGNNPDFTKSENIRQHTPLIQDFYHSTKFNYEEFKWFPLNQLSILPCFLSIKYKLDLPDINRENVANLRPHGVPFWDYERYITQTPKIAQALFEYSQQDYVPSTILDLRPMLQTVITY